MLSTRKEKSIIKKTGSGFNIIEINYFNTSIQKLEKLNNGNSIDSFY